MQISNSQASSRVLLEVFPFAPAEAGAQTLRVARNWPLDSRPRFREGMLARERTEREMQVSNSQRFAARVVWKAPGAPVVFAAFALEKSEGARDTGERQTPRSPVYERVVDVHRQ